MSFQGSVNEMLKTAGKLKKLKDITARQEEIKQTLQQVPKAIATSGEKPLISYDETDGNVSAIDDQGGLHVYGQAGGTYQDVFGQQEAFKQGWKQQADAATQNAQQSTTQTRNQVNEKIEELKNKEGGNGNGQ